MKLFFICPKKKALFDSDSYTLLKGHRIVEKNKGERELQGRVRVNEPCPLCGAFHEYDLQEVMCSRG